MSMKAIDDVYFSVHGKCPCVIWQIQTARCAIVVLDIRGRSAAILRPSVTVSRNTSIVCHTSSSDAGSLPPRLSSH